MTLLPKRVALKMDGARVSGLYPASEATTGGIVPPNLSSGLGE